MTRKRHEGCYYTELPVDIDLHSDSVLVANVGIIRRHSLGLLSTNVLFNLNVGTYRLTLSLLDNY